MPSCHWPDNWRRWHLLGCRSVERKPSLDCPSPTFKYWLKTIARSTAVLPQCRILTIAITEPLPLNGAMSGAVGNLHRSPLLWAVVKDETATARALVAANPALRRDAQSAGGSEAYQARFALGRALALHLLAQTASGGWTIETTERGKPIARGEVERHVSISHTGSLVAAAVSSIGPIGIDVEGRDRVRDFIGLASAAFGPAEVAEVAVQGAAAFYRIWTVREAISKATGDGLPTVVDRQDRVPEELPDGKWIFGRDGWLLAHDVIEAGVSLALAVRLSKHEAATVESAASVAVSRMWVEY